ncbi:RidA family protein [Paraflavitalea sp. CAU 1676]|uniref:RidA family protein n=1 Tax=Paraflavitalea sp. CAU 1676 TaxID=3032598 RepID=UPI0023DAFFBC|nr:RidA family protein [Paraflavitalea sp. CAU 1676]MDF2189019.1 RidA family protein [Paraflavitalea sp. CAU 1676]
MATMIEHINPDSLLKSPAFSQAVTVEGGGKTIYIGGQDAVLSNNELVGRGDLNAQTVQVMKNIRIALEAAGGGWKDVVKLNIFLKQGQDAGGAFKAAQSEMKGMTKPPVVTVVYVAGFGNPDFLLEVDAVAFVPAS